MDASTAALAGAGIGALAAVLSTVVAIPLRERSEAKRLREERRATAYLELYKIVSSATEVAEQRVHGTVTVPIAELEHMARAIDGAFALAVLHASDQVYALIGEFGDRCASLPRLSKEGQGEQVLRQIVEKREAIFVAMRDEFNGTR